MQARRLMPPPHVEALDDVDDAEIDDEPTRQAELRMLAPVSPVEGDDDELTLALASAPVAAVPSHALVLALAKKPRLASTSHIGDESLEGARLDHDRATEPAEELPVRVEPAVVVAATPRSGPPPLPVTKPARPPVPAVGAPHAARPERPSHVEEITSSLLVPDVAEAAPRAAALSAADARGRGAALAPPVTEWAKSARLFAWQSFVLVRCVALFAAYLTAAVVTSLGTHARTQWARACARARGERGEKK